MSKPLLIGCALFFTFASLVGCGQPEPTGVVIENDGVKPFDYEALIKADEAAMQE